MPGDEPPDKDAQLRDARERFAVPKALPEQAIAETRKIGADLRAANVKQTPEGASNTMPDMHKPNTDGSPYKAREPGDEPPNDIPPPGKGKSR